MNKEKILVTGAAGFIGYHLWKSLLDDGVKIYGRSDTTLNPGGIRIGTSEIYKVIESIEYIDDSLAIGKNFKNDEKIILFVK